MRYKLVVLTHGDSESLATALSSFNEHVPTLPTETLIVEDAARPSEANEAIAKWWGAMLCATEGPLGFCGATRYAWQRALNLGLSRVTPTLCEYVFWLEHDFIITRDIFVDDLAALLEHDRRICQVALMRNAVNEDEQKAGGLFEHRRDEYVQRNLMRGVQRQMRKVPWLSHQSYFTTNPSLMRTAFMRERPWPGLEIECEGRFGIELRQAGFHFAAMGEGEPWCEHVGVRTGFGY